VFGRGWGHGVGMCQVGAYGMAMQGATYDEILKKYYTGIALSRMW
jgi:stage II sporulation protein D